MGLPDIPKDLQPVIILQVQDPPQVLKSLNPLYATRFVFSCKAERSPLALSRNFNILPLPPYLRVPLVFDYTTRWHVHTPQVIAGHWLPPVYYH